MREEIASSSSFSPSHCFGSPSASITSFRATRARSVACMKACAWSNSEAPRSPDSLRSPVSDSNARWGAPVRRNSRIIMSSTSRCARFMPPTMSSIVRLFRWQITRRSTTTLEPSTHG